MIFAPCIYVWALRQPSFLLSVRSTKSEKRKNKTATLCNSPKASRSALYNNSSNRIGEQTIFRSNSSFWHLVFLNIHYVFPSGDHFLTSNVRTVASLFYRAKIEISKCRRYLNHLRKRFSNPIYRDRVVCSDWFWKRNVKR